MTDLPGTFDLTTSRVIPASPEEVFDAFTDAGKQMTWYGILDEEPGIIEIEVDLRVGGKQTAAWGPDRDTLFREEQIFLEIERPHRLVTESVSTSHDGMSMRTRVEVTFEEHEEGTLMIAHQSGFPTAEIRDHYVEEGWNEGFNRIAAFLAQS